MALEKRCIFRHHWALWKQYELEKKAFPQILQGKEVIFYQQRQHRTCERCGKMQDEELYGS